MSGFEDILSRRAFTKTSLAASIALTSGASVASRAFAQDGTPVGETTAPAGTASASGLPPLPEGATLVAQGLWNPRFLAFGDDGTLYITESGVGGDDVMQTLGNDWDATPGATPVGDAEGEPGTAFPRGYTGQVSKVTPDGTQTVVVDGLVSYSDGFEDTGPVGLALDKGVAYFAIGGVAVGVGAIPLPEENTLNKVDVTTGEVTLVANLGQYEVENNPNGADVNPNLYMVARNTDGLLLVADAGGNTIYSVDPDSGEFTLAGIVPDLTELTGLTPTPEMGSGQAVPTSVTVADDGTIYVGMLRESWPAEAPSVLTMAADGTFAPFETSEPLTFTVSLVAGPDGKLYASELFGEMTDQGPGPGRVLSIAPDGTVTPVVEGVMMPHGVAFDADGHLYVAINTMMSSPGMPAGQIIRIDRDASGA